MNRHSAAALLVVVAGVACAGLGVKPDASRSLPSWPAGDPHYRIALLGFAVHVPSETSTELAEKTVREAVEAEWPGVALFRKKERRPGAFGVDVLWSSEKGFEAEYVASVGRGLSEAEAKLLASKHLSFALFAVVPVAEVPLRLPAVLRATANAADALGGVGDDLSARQFLSSAVLRERATEGFENGVPIARHHVALHSYRTDDGSIRTVSVGMMKFGLPNIAVSSHAPSNVKGIVGLVNNLIQALVEGREIGKDGTFELDLSTLRARSVAKAEQEFLVEGGTGKVVLTLAVGKHQDGDDEGEPIELTFENFSGEPFVRQEQALKRFYGSSDSIVWVDSRRADKARALALERLETLRPGFEERQEKHERLLVKAPFKTDTGGTEWMWVEVLVWKGREMRGVLENTPFHVSSLKAGMRVTVSQDTLFDYLRIFPDGRQEGNTTAEFLRED